MVIRIVALALTATLLISACGETAPAAPSEAAAPGGATITAIAAESYLADIAQNVAGERLTIATLIPLGVDPHGFEPTPADVRKIAESDLLLVNGAGFEEFLDEMLANAGGERLVIEASAGLNSRNAREGETAVMSVAEQAEALCAEADTLSAETLSAGAEPAAAIELGAHSDEAADHAGDEAGHDDEMRLLRVTLAPQAAGGYAGFLKLDAELGELAIATSGGMLNVTTMDGAAVEIEDTLPLACAGLTQATVMDLTAGEYLIELSGFDAPDAVLMYGAPGGHHHDKGDPHFWLDPINVISYVGNIRDGLIAADPAGAEIYRANAARYIAQLEELDRAIRAQVEQIPAEERKLVTNHESFGYYADRYGFRIIGTIVPSVSSGAAPSAQQLARLTERIRSSGAQVIFVEIGSNPQLAEQLARDTDIRIVTDLYTHSLSQPDGPAPTYIAMMRYNTERIVAGLQAGE